MSSLVCNESFQDSNLKNLSLWWTIGPGEKTPSIIDEQVTLMRSSGILRQVDAVYAWAYDYHRSIAPSQAYSQENLQEQKWFRQLFQKHSDLWSKLRPLPLSAEATSWWMQHEKSYEFPVLEAAHDVCRAAGGEGRRHAVAYVHTKGSWNAGAHRDKWRHVMNHFVISRYRDCLHHLGCGYATCGALLYGEALMYAGNFWWARCDYLRRLRPPRPSEADLGSAAPDKGRYLAELWVLSGAQGWGASFHKSCWGTPRPGRPGPSYPVCCYRVPEAARPC